MVQWKITRNFQFLGVATFVLYVSRDNSWGKANADNFSCSRNQGVAGGGSVEIHQNLSVSGRSYFCLIFMSG